MSLLAPPQDQVGSNPPGKQKAEVMYDPDLAQSLETHAAMMVLMPSQQRKYAPYGLGVRLKGAVRHVWEFMNDMAGTNNTIIWPGFETVASVNMLHRVNVMHAVNDLRKMKLIGYSGKRLVKGVELSIFDMTKKLADKRLVVTTRREPWQEPPDAETPKRVRKTKGAKTVKSPVEKQRVTSKGEVVKEPPMSEEERQLATSTWEKMMAYMCFGREGLHRTDFGNIKPTRYNWTNTPGYTDADPKQDSWTMDQFSGYYWVMVSVCRSRTGKRIDFPDWGKLNKSMKAAIGRFTRKNLFTMIYHLTTSFEIIRFMAGERLTIDLSESSINNQIIIDLVTKFMELTDVRRAEIISQYQQSLSAKVEE